MQGKTTTTYSSSRYRFWKTGSHRFINRSSTSYEFTLCGSGTIRPKVLRKARRQAVVERIPLLILNLWWNSAQSIAVSTCSNTAYCKLGSMRLYLLELCCGRCKEFPTTAPDIV